MVLPMNGGRRRLSLAFSTSGADVIFTDSQSDHDGARVTVFHTDYLSLVLRAAGAGASIADLQLISADTAEDHFKEVLTRWHGTVPVMLKGR